VAINGTAEITASVVESAGTAVHNGTTVTFTTSLGSVYPTDAQTTDGKATVTFNAGTASGTAEINAFSGANSAKATVKILVGAAAASSITAMAVPATIPASGGTTVITATVYDVNNNPLTTVPVSFATDVGSLVPTTAMTNASGQAQSTLSSYQTATVTVTAGQKVTGTVRITATAAPILTITVPSTSPSVGQSATFSVNVQAGTNSAPIKTVTIDFGDGTRTNNLGAATGTISVPHIFSSAGVYTVTAIATDASGQTTSVSVPVNVFPAVPFTLTINASSAKVNTPLTITAIPAAGSPTIISYEWDFGDGTKATTTLNAVSHTYTSVPTGNQAIVSVIAIGSDGRQGVGSTVILINP